MITVTLCRMCLSTPRTELVCLFGFYQNPGLNGYGTKKPNFGALRSNKHRVTPNQAISRVVYDEYADDMQGPSRARLSPYRPVFRALHAVRASECAFSVLAERSGALGRAASSLLERG